LSVVTARPRESRTTALIGTIATRDLKTGPASCARMATGTPAARHRSTASFRGIFAFVTFTCFPLPLFSVDRRGDF
jgi:hypothetical protein